MEKRGVVLKGKWWPTEGKELGCQGARNTFHFSHALPLRGQQR